MTSHFATSITRATLRISRPFIVVGGLLAAGSMIGCTSPFTAPEGYSEIPHVRVSAVTDSRATVEGVHVYRSERRTLIVGQVYNQTMLAFRGGQLDAALLDSGGGIKAEGSGTIQSSLVGPHASALFRVSLEYAGPFEACRITLHPDVEGR